MEKDPDAIAKIANLQDLLREYVPLHYGPEPYRFEMQVEFPEAMKGIEQRINCFNMIIKVNNKYLWTLLTIEQGKPDIDTIKFTLGGLKYVPYSTYYFLDIASNWQHGNFHRNAGHVLQAMVMSKPGMGGMAFQEYSPEFPHRKFTMGYAGRPGGPAFYISTVDNTHNHGPGSQGSKTEADGCFGKIEDDYSQQVVKRMQHQPGASKGAGFIQNSKNFIKILSVNRLK